MCDIHRLAEIAPLRVSCRTAVHQQLALFLRLHAFRYDANVELSGDVEDRAEGGGAVGVVARLVDIALRNFQVADPVGPQVVEGRVLRPEVVNSDFLTSKSRNCVSTSLLASVAGARLASVTSNSSSLSATPHFAAVSVTSRTKSRLVLSCASDKLIAINGRATPWSPPQFHLSAGLIEDPMSQRHHGAGFFRDRDKHARCQKSASGMIPAHQRFHPDNLAGYNLHLRLKMRLQFVLVNGPAQVIGQRHALDDLLIEVIGMEAVTVTALILRAASPAGFPRSRPSGHWRANTQCRCEMQTGSHICPRSQEMRYK